ncbi:MAG: lectin-like protein [Pseudomonadota bacterium]
MNLMNCKRTSKTSHENHGHKTLRLLIQTLFILSIIIPGNLVFAQSGSFADEVSSGRQLVETFDALANNPMSNKRSLQKIAMEISNNTEARLLLKSPQFQSLGSRYYGLWFDGKEALVGDIIERMRDKLLKEGYPLEVVAMIIPIQNQASRTARRAPMDFDIGINTEGSLEQARKLLKQLRGAKGVDKFHNDLQMALEESYSEIAQQLGARTVRPDKAILTGATHFHPEAYADAHVLKTDGLPGKDLIQQTADVSKYKVDYFKNRVPKVFSEKAAWKESARGTLKDLEKMERIFLDLEKNIGVKPKLSDIDLKVKGLLEKVAAETDTAAMQALNNEIKVLAGTDIYGACKILIDNMEAAIRMKPTGILALDLLLRKLFQEADPAKRLELVQSQLKTIRNNPKNVAESQRKALEELERVITAVQGDTFLMKVLKSPTGQMLVVTALVNAPFAFYSMYQAYQQGEMNDLSDAAAVLIEFVPGGISVKKSLTQGMNAGTVLSFAKEALYFTPAWPLVLGVDVLSMSIEIKTAMNVANYKSGLIDLLVYNGKFDNGLLTHLELLDEKRIERADLEPFFLNTTYVAVKTSIPLRNWGLRINNLSEKAMEVYNEHYLKADPVLEQLRTAASTQLSEINKVEADKYLNIYMNNFIPGVAAANYLAWLGGFELVCEKSKDKWCNVFKLLKEQIEKRKKYVQKNIMIPDLIRMAEAKYSTLNAAGDLSKKMEDLQKALEELRGSPLGINLVDEINKKAKKKADATDVVFGTVSVDTKETKTMTQGAYWQEAFSAYEKIYKETINLKDRIQKETGYENLPVLQIRWSGDYLQDQLRIAQSIDGFSDDSKKIHTDIQGIKGSPADPRDMVDKQALNILGRVVFRWRAVLDMTNKAVPESEKTAVFGAKRFPVSEKNSSFYKEYEDALNEVRKLYGKKGDFQAQLKDGAKIITDKDFLLLNTPSKFKLEFTDKGLKKNYDNFDLSFKWTATPEGTIRPDDKGLEINFTADRPEQVTISVQVENNKEKVTGSLKVSLPVKVPDEKKDKSGSGVQKDGKAADGKPGTGEKNETPAADSKEGQKSPPQVQPDSYTKGQTGIAGGTDQTKGQTGIPSTPVTDGQVGETQGTGATATGTQRPIGTSDSSPDTGTTQDGPVGGKTKITSGVGTGKRVVKPPPVPPKEPPACTYEYSPWGDCSRGTKKQTRTVTGKKPAGCVEKDKPVLEQECKPPRTAEERKIDFLNCMCFGCQTGLPSMSGNFATEGDCKGMCGCPSPLGGSCRPVVMDDEKMKRCYASAYDIKDPDANALKKAQELIKQTNKKAMKPLKVKLDAGKCPITAHLGDIITLTASVEGGIPPHRYSWTGNGQAKENTFTFANSRQPGTHPISVTVKDSEDNSATSSCSVIVEAMTVKIELLDKGKMIPIGESRNFKGTVMSGGQAAKGDFYFLWQPHPEIQFSPFEKTGGSLSGTKATFNKLGKFKVWVIAHTYQGSVKTTIGESEQIEIEVSKPELTLSFLPQNPKIGQEVKLTVTEKPKMNDKAISFWWEISGNALNPGPLKGERGYTFKPKDTQPVTVTVHGKAKDGGDDLGEAKATITAQAYAVTIGEPTYRGPKPKIWNPQVWKSPEWKQGVGLQGEGGLTPGGGLVEVADNQFAVFQDIEVKAEVKPTPEKQPLRYDWTISPSGICGIPGGGQELRLNCSQTGTYTASVSVRDSENLVLGRASRAVSITVSQEDLDKAKGPLATLQADKTSLKTGETAIIKAAVQGGKAPYAYLWGDGVDGKGKTVRFSPKKSGLQQITIEVTDGTGKKASANLSIKVEWAKLEVDLKPAKTDIKLGETVNIKAEAKGGEAPFTYLWGPGVTGKGASIPFVAQKGGEQTVSVEVTDGSRQKATATLKLRVEVPKLEVTLKADKNALKIGETVLIQAVVKGGGPPVKSKWSAGVDAKGEAASFTPTKSGPYKVTIEVSDSAQQTANAGVDLKVEAPKLEVSLKADKNTLKPGEKSSLQAVVKGGEPPYTYQWGGGIEGKGDTGRFVADKPGTQKASVDIRDQAGQTTSASVDLKVEIPKLEVTLTVDKPTLKVGEKGSIQAKVKGGLPDYTYQWWSSFVSGKGDTASFVSNKPGLYKIWIEVKDKAGGKAKTSLDWKVEGGQEGQRPIVGGAEKIAIEPENLKLAPGETQTLRVFRVLSNGKKEPYTQGKVYWSGDVSQGIIISDQGRIQATSLAKAGARIKISTKTGSLAAEAWVEVVSSSPPPTQPATDPAGPSTAAVTPTILYSSGYDPRTDLGNLSSTKTKDLDKVNKIGGDFQKLQWASLDQKEQKIKDQQPGQAQAPEYLGTSTTSPTTMVPPTNTDQPVTGPSTAQPVSAQPSTTPTADKKIIPNPDISATFRGKKIKAVMVPGGLTWDQANAKAKSMGGVLVTLDSAEKNNFVYKMIEKDGNLWWRDPSGNYEGPWTGGIKEGRFDDPKKGWRWQSGAGFSYSNWDPREPNNNGGAEDRIVFFKKTNRWNDLGRNTKLNGLIIEMR